MWIHKKDKMAAYGGEGNVSSLVFQREKAWVLWSSSQVKKITIFNQALPPFEKQENIETVVRKQQVSKSKRKMGRLSFSQISYRLGCNFDTK